MFVPSSSPEICIVSRGSIRSGFSLREAPFDAVIFLCCLSHIKTHRTRVSWAMDPNNSLGFREKRKISEIKIFNTLVSLVVDCHGNQNEYILVLLSM